MRRFFLATMLCVVVCSAMACDICGCSAGAGYMGILPRFRSNFIGLRYNYSSSVSEHPKLFKNEAPLYSYEYFNTAEIWGRYVPHKRVQLFGFVPYNNFRKTEEGVTYTAAGLGDVTILASYVVLNTTDSMKHTWRHALQVGAGAKLPTGAYTLKQDGTLLNANLQPGTGSVDIPLNAMYTLRYKKMGLNIEANYRINTENSNGYKFGNRMASALRLFYWKNKGPLTLLPGAGVAIEHNQPDYNRYIVQDYTGTEAALGTAGIDIYYKNFSAGIKYYSKPFYQHTGEGQIKNNSKFSASIILLF